MLKLGPTLTPQDVAWWLVAIVFALSIAGAGAAIHASRACAPLVRWMHSLRHDGSMPGN